MADRVKATTIKVARAEGRHEECIERTFTGDDVWGQAHELLRQWSVTAPGGPGQSNLGVHKTDFWVTYEDGFEYQGTLGLHFEDYDLPGHIRGFVAHLDEYRDFYDHVDVDAMVAFANDYEIGAP